MDSGENANGFSFLTYNRFNYKETGRSVEGRRALRVNEAQDKPRGGGSGRWYADPFAYRLMNGTPLIFEWRFLYVWR